MISKQWIVYKSYHIYLNKRIFGVEEKWHREREREYEKGRK